jgi:hypothetical protein
MKELTALASKLATLPAKSKPAYIQERLKKINPESLPKSHFQAFVKILEVLTDAEALAAMTSSAPAKKSNLTFKKTEITQALLADLRRQIQNMNLEMLLKVEFCIPAMPETTDPCQAKDYNNNLTVQTNNAKIYDKLVRYSRGKFFYEHFARVQEERGEDIGREEYYEDELQIDGTVVRRHINFYHFIQRFPIVLHTTASFDALGRHARDLMTLIDADTTLQGLFEQTSNKIKIVASAQSFEAIDPVSSKEDKKTHGISKQQVKNLYWNTDYETVDQMHFEQRMEENTANEMWNLKEEVIEEDGVANEEEVIEEDCIENEESVIEEDCMENEESVIEEDCMENEESVIEEDCMEYEESVIEEDCMENEMQMLMLQDNEDFMER